MRPAAALLAALLVAAPAAAQDAIASQVRDIVANSLMVPAADVTAGKSFEELGADDESFLIMIGSVEEAFEIEISDEGIAGFRTVGDVIALVGERGQ